MTTLCWHHSRGQIGGICKGGDPFRGTLPAQGASLKVPITIHAIGLVESIQNLADSVVEVVADLIPSAVGDKDQTISRNFICGVSPIPPRLRASRADPLGNILALCVAKIAASLQALFIRAMRGDSNHRCHNGPSARPVSCWKSKRISTRSSSFPQWAQETTPSQTKYFCLTADNTIKVPRIASTSPDRCFLNWIARFSERGDSAASHVNR